MYYVHKKASCLPEIATFRTKTLHFFRVIRLNWQIKIELRGGPGPVVLNFVVSYCCKRKMLKRNWNWRNNRFFVTFLSLVKFQLGAGPLPPLWLRLYSNKRKQTRYSQIFREVSGVFQQNFNCLKNSAVLEPRTGQFSRTWGFEAKAKDLTFEAKAKDFKMCPRGRPRGQRRPRGLHLWLQSFAGASTVSSITESFCNKHLHFQNIFDVYFCYARILAMTKSITLFIQELFFKNKRLIFA